MRRARTGRLRPQVGRGRSARGGVPVAAELSARVVSSVMRRRLAWMRGWTYGAGGPTASASKSRGGPPLRPRDDGRATCSSTGRAAGARAFPLLLPPRPLMAASPRVDETSGSARLPPPGLTRSSASEARSAATAPRVSPASRLAKPRPFKATVVADPRRSRVRNRAGPRPGGRSWRALRRAQAERLGVAGSRWAAARRAHRLVGRPLRTGRFRASAARRTSSGVGGEDPSRIRRRPPRSPSGRAVAQPPQGLCLARARAPRRAGRPAASRRPTERAQAAP